MNQAREGELRDLIRDQAGQATSEYALLVFWTVLVVLASLQALQVALFDYYQDVASLICLPIP